ncbi:MAG: 50S ribosomal protein L5 [Nitrospinota bacterium]
MNALKEKYIKEIVPALVKELELKNSNQAPMLEKVVLNMGLGEAVTNAKLIEMGVYTLTRVSGQKPVVKKAKKAISTYKLRKGVPIGVMVTLRSERMYDFLLRLITAALPRVRDFRGLSTKAFDGRGNYNIGIKEQLIFPEVEYEKVQTVKGMNITIVTTAKTDSDGRALLTAIGLPFKN